jgi:hypothetical protein
LQLHNLLLIKAADILRMFRPLLHSLMLVFVVTIRATVSPQRIRQQRHSATEYDRFRYPFSFHVLLLELISEPCAPTGIFRKDDASSAFSSNRAATKELNRYRFDDHVPDAANVKRKTATFVSYMCDR